MTHLPPERKNFLSATSRLAITKLKRPKFSRPRREAPGSRFHVTFHRFGGQNTSRPRRNPPALSDLQAAAWAGVRALGHQAAPSSAADQFNASMPFNFSVEQLLFVSQTNSTLKVQIRFRSQRPLTTIIHSPSANWKFAFDVDGNLCPCTDSNLWPRPVLHKFEAQIRIVVRQIILVVTRTFWSSSLQCNAPSCLLRPLQL